MTTKLFKKLCLDNPESIPNLLNTRPKWLNSWMLMIAAVISMKIVADLVIGPTSSWLQFSIRSVLYCAIWRVLRDVTWRCWIHPFDRAYELLRLSHAATEASEYRLHCAITRQALDTSVLRELQKAACAEAGIDLNPQSGKLWLSPLSKSQGKVITKPSGLAVVSTRRPTAEEIQAAYLRNRS